MSDLPVPKADLIAYAAEQAAEARRIIESTAQAGSFDIGSTTVGALILCVEALCQALKAES